MSATERLRELLDERGVEYETEDRPTIRYTEWGDWVFSEPLDAKPHTLGAQCELMRIPATPEQAIAATLEPGTCKLTRASWDDGTCTWGCICSACDAHLEHETGIGYNFCPICGAKVVDE